MKTLVLTLEYPTRSSYYADWRDAFQRSPVFDTTLCNIFHASVRRRLATEIGAYELIIVLHSCTADTLDYAADLVSPLLDRRGRLVCFVGNELNLPWAPLGRKLAWLKSVAPDIVATQLPAEAGAWLYGDTGATVLALPHALNPEAFRPEVPQADRVIDIGARSWRYLAYLGDDDRNRIYDYFLNAGFKPPLRLDFSTEQRFDRAGWADFLNRCKATISTEVGSWYLERDDATVLAIRDQVVQPGGIVLRADSRLQRLARRLPYRVKSVLRGWLRGGLISHEAFNAETLDFADIHQRFFAGRARAPVYAKAISSRHFDAIGCQTLQIMFPGRYNDILRAGEHYVSLAPDFSNIAAVLEVLRDVRARQAIIDRAYDEIMAAHTYTHRLSTLLAALEQSASAPIAKRANLRALT